MNTTCIKQSETACLRAKRLVFYGPEKPVQQRSRGVPVEIKVPEVKIVVTEKEIKERLETQLKDYKRRRDALLKVLAQFKEKDDLDLRLKATQFEHRVLSETMDPAVLQSLRDVTMDDVQKQIDKVVEIANSTTLDEKVAVWLEARELEKIEEAVKRYNLMREVNVAMVRNLEKHFWPKNVYETLVKELQEGLPELKTEEVKDRKSVMVAIAELQRVMDKYKPQIDEAKTEKQKRYATAFYHAIGRVHDRNLNLLESEPAAFEQAAVNMIRGISEVPLSEIGAGENWRITYEGLTFTVEPSALGLKARLVDADAANREKYGRLGAFLDARKTGEKTALKEKKPEIDL